MHIMTYFYRLRLFIINSVHAVHKNLQIYKTKTKPEQLGWMFVYSCKVIMMKPFLCDQWDQREVWIPL